MASYTHNLVGGREDLSDIITNIAVDETPCYSKFGKATATAMTHSWLTDSLGTPGENKHLEDADFALSAASARVKLSNDVQIFMRGYFVTESQQAVLKAGVKDELSYQMQKCLKEIALDVEYAIINNSTKATAGSATEGFMGGIQYFNTTNVKANGGTPRALTEELINDALQLTWADGGKPDWLLVSGKNKRTINGFTGMALRTRSMDEDKVKNMVNIYESDTFRCRLA